VLIASAAVTLGVGPTTAESADASPAASEDAAAPAAVRIEDPSQSAAGAAAAVAGEPGSDDSAAGRESVAVVSQLQGGILEVLREAEALGYQGRLARISPTVDQTFDLRFMAEKVIGRHWKTLTDEQQARWVQVFGGMTKANYARRLDHHSGQRIEILGHEPAANETMLVRTRLQDPEGEDVDLTYRLHSVDGGWKIVDIYLNGTVSELALRRSEYASVLKRDGFDALLVSVNRKIDDLAAGSVDQ
jgi:phospholipid transport system substrate-binding protein